MKGAKEYGEDNNIRCYAVGLSIRYGMHHGAICGVYEGMPSNNRHTLNHEEAGGWLLVSGSRVLLSIIIQTLLCKYRPTINAEEAEQR